MNAKQSKKLRQLYRRGLKGEIENQAQQRATLKKIWKEDEDKELDPKFVNEPKARKEN